MGTEYTRPLRDAASTTGSSWRQGILHLPKCVRRVFFLMVISWMRADIFPRSIGSSTPRLDIARISPPSSYIPLNQAYQQRNTRNMRRKTRLYMCIWDVGSLITEELWAWGRAVCRYWLVHPHSFQCVPDIPPCRCTGRHFPFLDPLLLKQLIPKQSGVKIGPD